MQLGKLKFSPVVFIIIAALLWSLDGILRANLRTIPPALLVTLEHTVGLLLLSPFIPTFFRQFRTATTAGKVALFTTAIISGALGTIFYTAALAQIFYVPFSVVVLMQQLQPLFAVGLAAILLKEKISTRFIIAGIFALIGAYMLSFPTLLPNLITIDGRAQSLAALLALAAAFCWGAGTVFSRYTLKQFDFKAATAGRFIVTILASVVLTIVLGQALPLNSIEISQWAQLIIIAFSAGAVALLIYYKGLSKTEVKVSTFAELAWPISVFAIDILRGVTYTPTQIIGAVLLIAMINRISNLQKKQKEK